MSTFKDVYERITTQIIEAIEEGSEEFRMPWHARRAALLEPANAVSKRPYRGVNVLALWAAANARGFESELWTTYKQWQELGAQVKRGESGTCIVLWKPIEQVQDDDEGQEPSKGLLARGYTVFNAAQVDGYHIANVPQLSEAERVDRAEKFYARLGATIHHGGDKAYYNITRDHIVLPPFSRFVSPPSYYATLGHEVTHWSGAKHRLARDYGSRDRLDAWALEELVAELGAAFLCSRLGIPTEPRTDHAGYVQDWLRVLKQDKRAIFSAASKAQQATDWICDRSQHVADAA